jgi:hypothetical protein
MSRDYFWLTKDQFARLKPLLPNDRRGSMIGGLSVAKHSTIASPAGQRRGMARYIPRTRNGRRTSCAGPDR